MERDFVPRTLAAEPGGILSLAAGGKSLSDEERARLLTELRAGAGPTKLTIEALVFVQRKTPNRNFVRVKPSILKRLAKSFTGQPFLRDHAQDDTSKRGGTIVASELVEQKDGPGIVQRIDLVKPWAIEDALDGTMDRFSVGWMNTGPVECSECGAPLFRGFFGSYPSCEHMPGDVVEDKDGEKHWVEMVVTSAEGVEVSAVSVPAVLGTGIEEIRAALAAQRQTDPRERAVTKEKHMKYFAAIAVALSLAEDAGEPDILTAIGKLHVEKQAAEAQLATERADLATVRGERDKAVAELATAQDALSQRDIDQLITDTRREGKLLGAWKDGKLLVGDKENPIAATMRTLAKHDLAAAREMARTLPVVVPVRQLASVGTEIDDATQRSQVTEHQKMLSQRLGIPEDTYITKEGR